MSAPHPFGDEVRCSPATTVEVSGRHEADAATVIAGIVGIVLALNAENDPDFRARHSTPASVVLAT